MRANRRRDTKPEVALRSELHRRGYRFRVDFSVSLKDRRVRPDLVFTRQRVAVFVDGCFWHSCPQHGTQPKANKSYWDAKLRENIDRDLRNTGELEEEGWKVVRVWAHSTAREAADMVQATLKR
jgi:DNA mismatch endonuclease, patch repair protein